MAHTFEELKHKTVGQLRDIAKEIDDPAVQGYTQMNKEHLLQAICKALHIEMHAHHEVRGLNKTALRAKMKELKQKRDTALEARDSKQLKQVRRQIHHLKRQIHKATV
jgi:DNA-binding IclR family transcriptional regulator